MMREYKRYDEYQDSEVKWIGEIPEGWEINKSKFISEVLLSNINKKTNEYEPKVFLCNYTDVYYNDFIDLNIDFMIASTSFDKKKKLSLEVGDVIITKDSESPDDIGIPSYVNKTKDNLVCGYHLAMLKPYENIILGKFLFRLLESKLLKNQFSMKATGITRYSISLDTIKNIILILPPKKEQQKIASFLDQKTAEIDKIINKKEKLIDQLEKYKKSVITEAVTKGKLGDKYINEAGELVDEIEMKDSEVEWVGEIPEYWNIGKASYIFKKISSGTTPSSDNLNYYDGNIKWLMTGDLNDSYVYSTTKKITKKALIENSSLEIYPKDSLVIAMYGATIGKLGIIGDEMTTNQACCVLSDSTFNQVKYYYYWLLSKREALISLAQGGGQPNINQDLIKNFSLPIFSNTISRLIINYLDKKTELIDTLIQKTKASIQKYKEYKKSLIFEAVTGKIDLRDYELKGGEKIAEHRDTKTADRKRVSKVN